MKMHVSRLRHPTDQECPNCETFEPALVIKWCRSHRQRALTHRKQREWQIDFTSAAISVDVNLERGAG